MGYGSQALALSKYCGAKSYHLKYLYNIFEQSECNIFVDACSGMGSVSLNLPKGKYHRIIANDIDHSINNVWTHFKDPVLFSLLQNKLINTSYDLENHWAAKHIYAYPNRNTLLDFAWATIVCHRFSRNAMPKNVFQRAGRMRGGQNECINAWQNYIKNLGRLHEATQRIEIEKLDVKAILKKYRQNKVLFYIDVPYPFNTRKVKMYRTEMSDNQHQLFLNDVRDHPCKIVISGRPNDMYEYNLIDWEVDIRDITNNMSNKKKKVKEPEVVWTNFKWIK
jgi:DNA adenine methylase